MEMSAATFPRWGVCLFLLTVHYQKGVGQEDGFQREEIRFYFSHMLIFNNVSPVFLPAPWGRWTLLSLIQVFCTCCILRDVRAAATVGSYPRPVLSWGCFQSALGGGGVQGPGIVIHSTVLSPEYFYTSFKKW